MREAERTKQGVLEVVHRPGRGIDSSLESLLPPVRAAARRVLEELQAEGYNARVWETYRSHERTLEVARRRGTRLKHTAGGGIAPSMHTLGLALDVLEQNDLWRAPETFWRAVQRIGEAHGFVTITRDRPHLQAIEVAEQPEARGLFERGDHAALEELARQSLLRRARSQDLISELELEHDQGDVDQA